MSQYFRVEFLPSLRALEVPQGTSILDAAQRLGLALKAECGGKGACGKCHVYYKPLDPDSPHHFGEARLANMNQGLACRIVVTENLLVYVPPQSIQESNVHVLLDTADVKFSQKSDSRLTILPLELPPPSREDTRPDRLRLLQTLAQEGVAPQDFRLDIFERSLEHEHLNTLSEAFRRCDWKGQLVLLDDRFVDFLPQNETPEYYALAFDLGTTTLAAELVSLTERENRDDEEFPKRHLAARKNPQSVFGEDVISRIHATLESPEALHELRRYVLESLWEMLEELIEKAQLQSKHVVLVTLAGNTLMQQIFHALHPGPLGVSPFIPATERYEDLRAKTLHLPMHREGFVETFPILGGFVGGDLTAGILATGIALAENATGPVMLIDIGTNGEMILVHGEKIYAAAAAAGPAFEGARITHGMVAAPGAIDAVTFEETIQVHTINDLPPRGICGSALLDTLAGLLRFGVINSKGGFQTSGQYRDDIQSRMTNCEGQAAFRLSKEANDPFPIVFTQKDVRQLQLAAGAIRCGVRLLLNAAGLRAEELTALHLAGGFGNFIRPENAKRIGLIPSEIPLEAIRFSGNTALAGARELACNKNAAARIANLLRRTVHLDLSTCNDFSQVFAESMVFPKGDPNDK